MWQTDKHADLSLANFGARSGLPTELYNAYPLTPIVQTEMFQK